MSKSPLADDVSEALRLQRRALDLLEYELDDQFNGAVDALLTATTIVTTGVGKSGFVARKFAASLTSLGITATFMHSVDALHGDLGVVRPGTVVVMFSKSGETRELLDLLKVIGQVDALVVSITSRRSTSLSDRAGISLVAPIEREYDQMNILPTASTTTALILADLLVMAVAHRRPDSIEVLSRTHPLGTIGSLLGQRVDAHMHHGVSLPTVRSGAKLDEAIHELDRHALGIVCVVSDESKLVGILTDGDVRRLVERSVDVSTMSVDAVMTTAPSTVERKASLHDALQLMESRQRPIAVLPVLDAEKLVGVIRLHDVVRAQMAG